MQVHNSNYIQIRRIPLANGRVIVDAISIRLPDYIELQGTGGQRINKTTARWIVMPQEADQIIDKLKRLDIIQTGPWQRKVNSCFDMVSYNQPFGKLADGMDVYNHSEKGFVVFGPGVNTWRGILQQLGGSTIHHQQFKGGMVFQKEKSLAAVFAYFGHKFVEGQMKRV